MREYIEELEAQIREFKDGGVWVASTGKVLECALRHVGRHSVRSEACADSVDAYASFSPEHRAHGNPISPLARESVSTQGTLQHSARRTPCMPQVLRQRCAQGGEAQEARSLAPPQAEDQDAAPRRPSSVGSGP